MTQFIALMISLAIEIPIILLLIHVTKKFTCFVQFVAMFALVCGATLLTHPLAWKINQIMVYYLLFPLRITVIESVIILIEGFIFSQVLDLGWKKGLLFSFLANIASFCGGLIIFQVLQS